MRWTRLTHNLLSGQLQQQTNKMTDHAEEQEMEAEAPLSSCSIEEPPVALSNKNGHSRREISISGTD